MKEDLMPTMWLRHFSEYTHSTPKLQQWFSPNGKSPYALYHFHEINEMGEWRDIPNFVKERQ